MGNQEIFRTAANIAQSLETRLASLLGHVDEEQRKVKKGC